MKNLAGTTIGLFQPGTNAQLINTALVKECRVAGKNAGYWFQCGDPIDVTQRRTCRNRDYAIAGNKPIRLIVLVHDLQSGWPVPPRSAVVVKQAGA